MERKTSKGITLIALVITIIVLLILAGVSITTLTGENGLLTKANLAKEQIKEAAQKEQGEVNRLLIEIDSQTGELYDIDAKVNKPILLTGMKGIKFVETADKKKYEVSTDISDKADGTSGWYNYEAKEWANAQTEDGSMWVWIPRFAYKITSKPTYNDDGVTEVGGTIDVKFLIGTTDQYFDENGEKHTARRAKSADEEIDASDTTKEYVVHPAFTNESGINYANGGWDKELSGIWVAKFEAGFASGNNSAPVVASSLHYLTSTVWASKYERPEEKDGYSPARNWLDGEYTTTTTIKYPTFQGKTYAMNYINHNDAFNIARALNGSNNIYGLSSDSDSHLMKNSEWGAVAYLGQSQYGLNGDNIYINNVTLNNSTPSVYAVTGCASATDADGKDSNETPTIVATTIENINAKTPSNLYTWEQKEGTKASSSGTVFGIYDMSGGVWEKTAAYVANGHDNLLYGTSLVNDAKTTSTKYTTRYQKGENEEQLKNDAGKANYLANNKIYGDAIHETSTSSYGNTSWFKDWSYFNASDEPFSLRGGGWDRGQWAGLFFFYRNMGDGGFNTGFRAVLVAV